MGDSLMSLARSWNGSRAVSTLHDGYKDRLARPSDIQEYLPFLYETAKAYPGVRVLELGTRRGNSTLAFLAAAEAADGHVTSCDTANVFLYAGINGMGRWRYCPRWTFILGDDLSPQVQERLPAQVDVLFIDTSHFYDQTLAELRFYVSRVSPGGTVLLHDTRFAGDWSQDKTPAVARALDDYCEEISLEWENMPGEYGLGVIRL